MRFKRERFKQIRHQLRWSLQAISDQTGFGRATLYRWEKGINVPSEKKIRELAKFLDISVSEISDLSDV
jgi:transcriptional regulator with XRE-family HTH domain